MSCHIRFSQDPSHLQNFGSIPVFGLIVLVLELSSEESLEELENPFKDDSPELLFESLSCSLELEPHSSAMI